MPELPAITGSVYGSQTSSYFVDAPQAGNIALAALQQASPSFEEVQRRLELKSSAALANRPPIQVKEPIIMTIRIVKVYIADPNENLPLDKRILFSGEEKLTDLTDQELFFEVPVTALLADLNAVRAKTLDKKASEKYGRDVFLEPARIRDLKMQVVTVASF